MTFKQSLGSLALGLMLACSHATTDGTGGNAGSTAPATSFTTTKGETVALANTFRANSETIVVFYRGFY